MPAFEQPTPRERGKQRRAKPMAALTLQRRQENLRRQAVRAARHRRRRRGRRVRRDGRSVGLRQIDAAADGRGTRERVGRHDFDRRQSREQAGAEGSRHRDGLPELRALSAHERRAEHGVRAEDRRRGSRDRSTSASRTPPRRYSNSNRCSRASRASCRAGSGSASRWAARSCASRPCFCSTNRCRISTRKLRVQMRLEIQRLHARLATTSLYVTHDQIEAMTLAQRVIVMNRGPRRADRRADRSLRAAGDGVRRELHRLAGDESARRPRVGRRLRVRRRGQRSEVAAGGRAGRSAREMNGREWIVGIRPEHMTPGQPGIAHVTLERRFVRTARRGQSRARQVGQARRGGALAARASSGSAATRCRSRCRRSICISSIRRRACAPN